MVPPTAHDAAPRLFSPHPTAAWPAPPALQHPPPGPPPRASFRYFDLPKELRHQVLQKLPPPPARSRQLGELGRLHQVSRAFRRDCRDAFPGFYEGLTWSRSLRTFAVQVAAAAPVSGQLWRLPQLAALHAWHTWLASHAANVGIVDLAGVALPEDHAERGPSCFWIRQLLDEVLRQRPRLNVFILDDFPLRHWRCALAGRGLRLELLSLRGRPTVELPDDLHVTGDLDLTRQNMASLPRRLRVDGNLVLRDCAELRSLPPDLQVGGKLLLHGCARLEQVPAGIQVGGDVEVRDCDRLRRFLLADVYGSLTIHHCRALRSFGPSLSVSLHLTLRGLPALERLPQDLAVAEDATFCHLSRLAVLGAELDLGASLYVHACPLLQSVLVPQIFGHLDVIDCASLRELAASLKVSGDLTLRACPLLSAGEGLVGVGSNTEVIHCPLLRLGEAVEFGGHLSIVGSRLTRVPAAWRLAADVTLLDTDLSSVPRPWRVAGTLHLGHNRGETLFLDQLVVERDLVLEDVHAELGPHLLVGGRILLRHGCDG